MAVSTGTAILASAAFAVGGNYLSSRGISQAAASGAEASAMVQMESTLAQLNEISYQFDYTQAALAEGRQLEYNAQNAFGTMLGINGPRTNTPEAQQYRVAAGAPSGVVDGRSDPGIPNYGAPRDVLQTPPGAMTNRDRSGRIDRNERPPGGKAGLPGPGIGAQPELKALPGEPPRPEFSRQAGGDGVGGQAGAVFGNAVSVLAGDEVATPEALDANQFRNRTGQLQTFGANIDYQPTVGPQGFVDPMADPTRLAGPDVGSDPFFNYVTSNRIAGETFEDDPYAQRVMDTGIYGATFEESPGYQFALEQGEQALERKNSRGGNYGGRAVKEALRYNQGMANQEFYNWAGGRSADLSRQDQAYGKWATARGGDLARSDAAFQNYMGREMYDVNRSDQTYQNYMANLRSASGLGGNINASVQSAQTAGGQAAGAYGNYGNALSNVYSDLAAGDIAASQQLYGGLNQSVQGGMKNYLTWQMLEDQ